MLGEAKFPFRLREGLGEGLSIIPAVMRRDTPSPDPSRKRKGSNEGECAHD